MSRIGIDEIIALNDEILALTQAGVPLGRGLLDLGTDMPRQLRAAAESIGARLEQGETLESIVASQQSNLPPVYRAVVAAGIESGRLPVSLERLSSTLARVAELQRAITLAAVYPLLLVLLATMLITFFGTPLMASIRETFLIQRLSIPRWLSAVFDVGIGVGPYAVYVGLGFVVLVISWLSLNRRVFASRAWLYRIIGWLPGLYRLVNAGRTAAFLETLRLLVSQQIPLDRAMTLAAESTGDSILVRDATSIADAIRRGENANPQTNTGSIPPLVGWLLTTEQTHQSLTAALDNMSETYTERTERIGELLRTFLPIWLTVVVGGSVTSLYVASITIPWITMLRTMSEN